MKKHIKRQALYILLVASLLLVVIYGISYMKSQTDRSSVQRRESIASVTLQMDSLEEQIDTLRPFIPDSLQRDGRPPFRSGEEDGYITAVMDVRNGTPKANYDEHSHYLTEEERSIYAEGYRKGYANGLQIDTLH